MQQHAESGHIQPLFTIIFMVRNTEPPAEINEFQPYSLFLQPCGQSEQHIHSGDIALAIHEQGTNMLIDADQTQAMSGRNGKSLIHPCRLNPEFGLLSSSDHLGAVSRADSRIKTDHHPAAGIDAPVKLQLGERVHADKKSPVRGVLQFVSIHVVADIQNLVGSEACMQIKKNLPRRHGIHYTAFFTNDGKKHWIGIRLGRVIHVKTWMRGKPCKLAAPTAKNVFVIHIQGRPETGRKFKRIFPPEKIHPVGI